MMKRAMNFNSFQLDGAATPFVHTYVIFEKCDLLPRSHKLSYSSREAPENSSELSY